MAPLIHPRTIVCIYIYILCGHLSGASVNIYTSHDIMQKSKQKLVRELLLATKSVFRGFFSYIPGIFAITIQSRQSSGTKCATAKDQSNSNLLQFMVFYLRRTSLSMQTLMFRRPICEHFFHFMVCHVHTHAGETTELWLK